MTAGPMPAFVADIRAAVDLALHEAALGRRDPWAVMQAVVALEAYDDARRGVPHLVREFRLHRPLVGVCIECKRPFRWDGEAMRRHRELSGHDAWRREERWPWELPPP